MSPTKTKKRSKKKAKGTPPKGPITRDDIESKFREIQGEVDVVADEAVNYVLLAGVAVLAGVVVIAFVMGARRGRRKTTIVEVRRV